jgi:hypothetical protein
MTTTGFPSGLLQLLDIRLPFDVYATFLAQTVKYFFGSS